MAAITKDYKGANYKVAFVSSVSDNTFYSVYMLPTYDYWHLIVTGYPNSYLMNGENPYFIVLEQVLLQNAKVKWGQVIPLFYQFQMGEITQASAYLYEDLDTTPYSTVYHYNYCNGDDPIVCSTISETNTYEVLGSKLHFIEFSIISSSVQFFRQWGLLGEYYMTDFRKDDEATID